MKILPKKITLVVAFALFSLFFGAGNLILPPMLGYTNGSYWLLVALGFCLSAVLIPLLGILAHARLQGTLFDFAQKVSPTFSLVYCVLIYAIAVLLPAPRNASVTHEIAVAPLFHSSSWLTSAVYFGMVLVFALNRSKILDVIGKYLTPAIVLVLLAIIGAALYQLHLPPEAQSISNAFGMGILEGYQTFDAIGAVVVGAVIIISINLKYTHLTYTEKRVLIMKSGILAGIGLLLVYVGLIYTGALHQNLFEGPTTRPQLLMGISKRTLGTWASVFLSVLVSLACFTTAVGIVTGAADFMAGRFQNSRRAYITTAMAGCILGLLMGQFQVGFIIEVAVPILMLVYPLTIVLIILNLLPERWATQKIFRWVVATTLLFSLPDFFQSIGWPNTVGKAIEWIPLGRYQLGWVLPALAVFLMVGLTSLKRRTKASKS